MSIFIFARNNAFLFISLNTNMLLINKLKRIYIIFDGRLHWVKDDIKMQSWGEGD